MLHFQQNKIICELNWKLKTVTINEAEEKNILTAVVVLDCFRERKKHKSAFYWKYGFWSQSMLYII
jgi:hypothetical protein